MGELKDDAARSLFNYAVALMVLPSTYGTLPYKLAASWLSAEASLIELANMAPWE